MLVNHADMQIECVLRRSDGDWFPVDGDLAAVREIDTRQHIHERGFSAAVFTEQRENFSSLDVKANFVVRYHLTEGLGDVDHSDRY